MRARPSSASTSTIRVGSTSPRDWLRGADTLFDALVEVVPWTQGKRWMYERMVDDPRLSCWYPASEPLPHQALASVKAALERRYEVPFFSVGLNYYRDGNDSVAWHCDRELHEHEETRIAILTLGSRRPFLLRPTRGRALAQPHARCRRSARDGRPLPDGLGAQRAEGAQGGTAHLVHVALDASDRSRFVAVAKGERVRARPVGAQVREPFETRLPESAPYRSGPTTAPGTPRPHVRRTRRRRRMIATWSPLRTNASVTRRRSR